MLLVILMVESMASLNLMAESMVLMNMIMESIVMVNLSMMKSPSSPASNTPEKSSQTLESLDLSSPPSTSPKHH